MNNDLIKFPVQYSYQDKTYSLYSWKHLFEEWGIDHMEDLMIDEYQSYEVTNPNNNFQLISKYILIGTAVTLFRFKDYLQEFSKLNPMERIDVFTPALLSYIRDDKRMKISRFLLEGEMREKGKNLYSKPSYELLGLFE